MIRIARTALALVALCVTLGCRAPDPPAEVGEAMGDESTLAGRWLKSRRPACAEPYPDEIEFSESGVYRASSPDDPGRFLLWSGGDYERSDPGHLKIQSATDAMHECRIRIEGDELRVTDSDGCEFAYRRAPSG